MVLRDDAMDLPEGRLLGLRIEGVAGFVQQSVDVGVGVGSEVAGAVGMELLSDVLGAVEAPLGQDQLELPVPPYAALPLGFIDEAATLPEAEIVFIIRNELPKTLTDVVFRRMMTGLDADQGGPHYARIAEIAAAEFGWDDAHRDAELLALRVYAGSLQVGQAMERPILVRADIHPD